MKQWILLLLAFNAGILTSQAQEENWQRVSVSDSVTTEFPAEPKKYAQNGAEAYSIYLDSVLYSVAIMRDAKSENIADEDKQTFYDGIIEGAVDRVHGAEPATKTKFVSNGFEGVEVTFQPQLNKLQTLTTMRIVLINGTVFTQFFSAIPNAAHLAARQRFFASFTPHQRPGPPVKTRAYRLGELVGQVAFYGLLLAGVFYLVRRPGRNNRPNATT